MRHLASERDKTRAKKREKKKLPPPVFITEKYEFEIYKNNAKRRLQAVSAPAIALAQNRWTQADFRERGPVVSSEPGGGVVQAILCRGGGPMARRIPSCQWEDRRRS